MAEATGVCLIAHPSAIIGGHAARALAGAGWVTVRVKSMPAAREQIERRGCDVLVASTECEELIAGAQMPAIALVARGDLPARLLDLGADAVCSQDPLREAELRALARLLWRPARGLRVELRRHRATLDGHELALTSKQFELLAALAARPGDLLCKSELCRRLWPAAAPRSAGRALDAHVRRLKQRLGACDGLIQTVWGLGYRLNAGSPLPLRRGV